MLFSKSTEAGKFDPLRLQSINDHPSLAPIFAELDAAGKEHDEAKAAYDSLLAEASSLASSHASAQRQAIRYRKQLKESRGRLEEAEERLEAAREAHSRAVDGIRGEVKDAYLSEGRKLFTSFRDKMLAMAKEHQALLDHNDRAGRLLGVAYPRISFRPFTLSNGGESQLTVWCAVTARELGLKNGKE